MIEIGIEITTLQDLRSIFAFIDDGVHRALETELQVLGQIEFDIHVPIPGKVLAEGQIHRFAGSTCQIAHLHMTEGAVHIGIERP